MNWDSFRCNVALHQGSVSFSVLVYYFLQCHYPPWGIQWIFSLARHTQCSIIEVSSSSTLRPVSLVSRSTYVALSEETAHSTVYHTAAIQLQNNSSTVTESLSYVVESWCLYLLGYNSVLALLLLKGQQANHAAVDLCIFPNKISPQLNYNIDLKKTPSNWISSYLVVKKPLSSHSLRWKCLQSICLFDWLVSELS